MGPQSGITYTDVFNEVTFDYKSDLPIGDTLYLLIIRYDGLGTQIEQILKPAAYGTHSSWTNGSVSVPATPQGQLAIGFVIGNPFFGPKPTPDVWARIDKIILKNGGTATTNLPNYSFENWTTVSTEEADNWYTLNRILAAQGIENANKTTDSNNGTYAIELSTIYYPKWEDTIGGMLSIGGIDLNSGGDPFAKFPYNASPTNFEYAYKYSGANGDLSANLFFEFYNSGSTIGGGSVSITDQTTYFTGNMPITLSGTPDSVRIVAFSGDSLGSVLKIDDLAFTGGNVGIDEFSKLSLDIYPNPANDFVMVKSEDEYDINIIDVTGKVVFDSYKNSGIQTIDTKGFNKGVYFVRINSHNKSKTQKLIIQ